MLERKTIHERNADYDWKNRILEAWSVDEDQAGFGNGNLDCHLILDSNRKCAWSKRWRTSGDGKYSFYEAIDSPLLLYRLACTFDFECVSFFGASGYKAVWHLNLVHNETQERVGFGEHKGASGFWTKYNALDLSNGNKEIPPAEFLEGLSDLVEYLISDVCAHNYDGLVAGNIA